MRFFSILILFLLVLFGSIQAQEGVFQTNFAPLQLRRPVNNPEFEQNIPSSERSSVLPPANDNCGGAMILTVNGTCVTDSTATATTQTGENLTPCGGSGFNQTVWYRFTATATRMWVQLYAMRFSGSGAMWGPTAWTAAVYAGNNCPPAGAPISCANSSTQGNGDRIIENILSGLTVGQTYLIQVGYRTGSGVNLVPTYCISVGDQFTPNCNTCANPCGNACGYATTPSVSTVTASCPPYQQRPYIEGAVADTQCYRFTAVNSTVSFNVIVNSTCQSGNVTNFTWNLYTSACGTAIQSGTLSNLTFNGLTPGQQYIYCYSFTTPSDCYHTAYYPYFVGAAPLPVEMLFFTGKNCEEGVCLEWSTASELNNERFVIERSTDGFEFYPIGELSGSGTTSMRHDYSFIDRSALNGKVYYRLTQYDFDGLNESFGPIAVKVDRANEARVLLFPNPAKDKVEVMLFTDRNEMSRFYLYDLSGKLIFQKDVGGTKGVNQFSLPLEGIDDGIFHVIVQTDSDLIHKKLIVAH